MATAISKNSSFRCIFRSLTSYSVHQLRSTKPSFRLFHGAPENLLHRPLPLPQAEIRLDRRLQSLAMYRRCLCSSTATVNQANSATKGSSEGTSGKGENSDQSQHTAEQGKPVRGGPVSWLSFLFLIATGGGLIFYYDKEKKRHIEGRLLW